MHGIVFAELKKFVDTNYGVATWFDLLCSSGLEGKIYFPNQPYPDDELLTIIGEACKATGMDKNALLERFGKFIVPDLLSVFKYTIDVSWKTLDLIENVEKVIHKAVRINNKGAEPPKLSVTRISRDLLEIAYRSPRRMEHLGVGIIKGIADNYKEIVAINLLNIGAETSIIKVKSL